MNKPVIEVTDLSKVYRIGHERKGMKGTATLRDSLVELVHKPIELITGRRLRKEEFWALKGVSFEVQQGDVVGIIGRNGSGKSTLLKILSQIVEPTTGEIRMRGKVASLLEVGTGFHPELTGRENIFFNGAILGMKRKEIISKFDEIVAFSEVEQFLDTPVKFYSSGMYVRLAFAVAAHLDPDILIVDEVLAVGDAAFQKKSLGKMKDVASQGRTVLFVSHNMESVSTLCNKAMYLNNGALVGWGVTDKVIQEYIAVHKEARSSYSYKNDESKLAQILNLRLLDDNNAETTSTNLGKPWSLSIEYRVRKDCDNCLAAVEILTPLGEIVYFTSDTDTLEGLQLKKPGTYLAKVTMPGELLIPGDYTIRVSIQYPNVVVHDYVDDVPFHVLPAKKDPRNTYFSGRFLGYSAIKSTWRTEPQQ
jgi:lipopolysaccharide transport system ATP-binding protein